MKKLILTATLAIAFIFNANAQSENSFKRFSTGIDAGTYGGGVWGATNIGNNFVLKAGFNYFGLGISSDLQTKMNGTVNNEAGTSVKMNANFGQPSLRMPHGKLIVEYYPAANGIFSVALGTYIGAFDFIFDGHIENYQSTLAQHGANSATFQTMGVSLTPREDGTFDGRLRMGNAVKPYLGIGLGRSIPKNRVGFQFNLGVAYQGDFKFVSDQAVIDNIGNSINDNADSIPDDLGIIETISNLARFWPVMNFSLSYRF